MGSPFSAVHAEHQFPTFRLHARVGLSTSLDQRDCLLALYRNGSTEFWLGSHLNTTNEEQLWRSSTSPTPTCDVTPACIAERLKTRPGEQIRVPFGTVMLRDMRTW